MYLLLRPFACARMPGKSRQRGTHRGKRSATEGRCRRSQLHRLCADGTCNVFVKCVSTDCVYAGARLKESAYRQLWTHRCTKHVMNLTSGVINDNGHIRG